MKATPEQQEMLLRLADLDTKLTQLDFSLRDLPERKEAEAFASDAATLADRARDLRIRRDDAAATVAKAEADVAAVRERRDRDQKRIDDGSVTNPNDLQRLIDEVTSIDRRIVTLEDEELAAMETLEAVQAELDTAEEQVSAVGDQFTERSAVAQEKGAALQTERESVLAQRRALTPEIPADVLALYEKVRERTGTTGAAQLHRKQCQGCTLTLDAGELARLKAAAADDVVRCDECTRILVRTSDSGL